MDPEAVASDNTTGQVSYLEEVFWTAATDAQLTGAEPWYTDGSMADNGCVGAGWCLVAEIGRAHV